MNILLVVSNWSETMGHAVRCTAAAGKLKERGHELAFLGPASYQNWIPEGVQFFASVPKRDYLAEDSPFFGFHTYEDVLYANGHLSDDHLVETVEREREVIRTFKPDCIVSDLQFTISIAAQAEEIPLASMVYWPMHPDFHRHVEQELPQRNIVLKRIRQGWNRVLKRYGQPAINHTSELIYGRSQLLISPTSGILEQELPAAQPDVHMVGQLVPKARFQDRPSWLLQWKEQSLIENVPLVFIYLSSLPIGINSREAFQVLYEDLRRSGSRVIFGLGPFNEQMQGFQPEVATDRIRFERFVPGDTAMELSDLAIFPGTHSMMVAAAKYEVTSLSFPDLFERAYNSHCLERAGLGRIGTEQDLRPGAVLELVQTVLDERKAGLSERSRSIRNELTAYEQQERFVHLVEKLGSEKRVEPNEQSGIPHNNAHIKSNHDGKSVL
ncbi:glycosyltransferase [Marinicrinis sediminis]|uniref:Glycosyltransferase n=1 Tax=Marinicrinis sediminis TaxID=1652465 RepID=A0ABW5R7M8_9BACL